MGRALLLTPLPIRGLPRSRLATTCVRQGWPMAPLEQPLHSGDAPEVMFHDTLRRTRPAAAVVSRGACVTTDVTLRGWQEHAAAGKRVLSTAGMISLRKRPGRHVPAWSLPTATCLGRQLRVWSLSLGHTMRSFSDSSA